MGGRNNQMNRNGRGWWVTLAGVALLALLRLGGADAWAAPVADRMNQTIPQPTPTGQATDVPTVTPTAPPDAPEPTSPPNPTATPAGGGGGGSGPTATPLPTNTPTAITTPTTVPGFGLLLQMEISPTLALQGDAVTLRFVVTNPGQVAAVNVQVRDELPAGLILVGSRINGGTASVEKSVTGATILHLSWPSLAAGAKVEAFVSATIATDTPNGAVIDNLAVAWADNAAMYTAGISIGMPPALLPTFD